VRRLQRLGHWLAGLGQGGRCCTHRVRTILSTPVANDISRRRGRVSQPGLSSSWLALAWGGWPGHLETGGRLGRFHIRVHLRWESRWSRRLLVVTGARCPLIKPVVAAVELRVEPPSPMAAEACSPAVFAHIPVRAGRLPEVVGWAGAGAAG
jgi:hypothetical protein